MLLMDMGKHDEALPLLERAAAEAPDEAPPQRLQPWPLRTAAKHTSGSFVAGFPWPGV